VVGGSLEGGEAERVLQDREQALHDGHGYRWSSRLRERGIANNARTSVIFEKPTVTGSYRSHGRR